MSFEVYHNRLSKECLLPLQKQYRIFATVVCCIVQGGIEFDRYFCGKCEYSQVGPLQISFNSEHKQF